MAYVVPQVQVHQEFTQQASPTTDPLRAFIIGPNYKLFRYSESDEKLLIGLGEYDPDADQTYSWPSKPSGSTVDTSYTRLFVDDALLKYFEDQAAADSTIQAVRGKANQIRSDSVSFKANGATYPRSAVLENRDVAVGDVARISGIFGGEEYSLETYVTGFVAEVVAAVVGSPTANSANESTQGASTSSSQTGGVDNLVDISSVSAAAYDGLDDDRITETYTIEVIQASTGGVGSSGKLKVTSASGDDDVAEVIPDDFGSATDIGTRGLTVTFTNSGTMSSSSLGGSYDMDDFVVGQTWEVTVNEAYTEPTVASAGSYTGDDDTIYVVRVTKGGASGTAEVTVSTTTGVDFSGPHVVTFGSAISIGTKGVTFTFSAGNSKLVKNDTWYVQATAEGEGAYQTLKLAHSVPDALRCDAEELEAMSSSSGTCEDVDLTVKLYIKKDIELTRGRIGFAPLVNWQQTQSQFVTKSGVVSYDATWVDDDGDMLPMDLEGGSMYLQYRALTVDYVDAYGQVSDTSDVEGLLGAVDPDNPLAYAVYKAVLNGGGENVRFMAVGSDDADGYTALLGKAMAESGLYSIVPLSRSTTIQDLVKSHINAASTEEKGLWRIGLFNSQVDDTDAFVAAGEATGDGTDTYTLADLMATVDDNPDVAGTQYTRVNWVDGDLLTKGVAAGDLLRINYADDGFGNETYEEYVVSSVESEDTLILQSGPDAPVDVASRFTIYRNLTSAAIATQYANLSTGFGSRRFYHIWPDQVTDGGEVVSGVFLCAALAGLIGSSTAQQNLTNVEVVGFDEVPRTTELMSASDLDTMAEAGTWIVTQDSASGALYNRHTLSTDMSSTKNQELLITKNLDSISYVFQDELSPYIGIANTTDQFLAVLERVIRQTLNFLSTNNYTTLTGGQIVNGEIVTLRRHSVLQDRLIIELSLELPYPFNYADVKLVV